MAEAAPQQVTEAAPSPQVQAPPAPVAPSPPPLPDYEAMQRRVGPSQFPQIPLPQRRGAVTTIERLRIPHRFGDMQGSTLTAVLHQLDKGQPEDWSDLCEFALTTDDHLYSLYETRITRVVQAEYQVVPNQFGDQTQAALAAELVNEQLGRIRGWRRFMRNALHAEAIGFSCNEIAWSRDPVSTQIYPEKLDFVHPHRFRYDEQWVPRIYDRGNRRLKEGSYRNNTFTRYGEVLNPSGWIIHIAGGVAGYPSVSGYMRSTIWHWMFKRWIESYMVPFLEKYGSGRVWGTVPKGAPDEVRRKALAALENIANDGYGVLEDGSTIEFQAMDVATSSDLAFLQAISYYERCATKAILGTSDAADPGQNGSQAAVGARTGATMDPRMVSDGMALCDTLHDTLFYWICYFNRHLFANGQMPPVPRMQFKTASDEQKVDVQDLATQGGGASAPIMQVPGALEQALQPSAPAEQSATLQHPGEASDAVAQVPLADPMTVAVEPQALPMAEAQPLPPAPPPIPLAPMVQQQLKSGDVKQALDIAKDVQAGKLQRASAIAMLGHFFGVDAATAETFVGVEPVVVQPLAAPSPEVHPASDQGQELSAPAVEMSATPEVVEDDPAELAALQAEIDELLGPVVGSEPEFAAVSAPIEEPTDEDVRKTMAGLAETVGATTVIPSGTLADDDASTIDEDPR